MNLLPEHNTWPFDLSLKTFTEQFYSEDEYNSFYQKGDYFQLIDQATTDYTADDVRYDLNYGFRCQPDYEMIDVMALGCSHTFGVGIPLEHTWGYQLTEKLGMNTDRYANFGVCGGSLETVLMIASNVIMRHKPRVVAVLAPHSERSQIMNVHNRMQTLFPGNVDNPDILGRLDNPDKLHSWFDWIEDNDAFLDAKIEMTKYCIQQMCVASQSKLLWVNFDNELRNRTIYDTEHLNRARDRTHVDGYHNNIFAEKFREIYR